jgi:hypothetical protein
VWRQSNASRYVRRFQSRRSLLVWRIFGARLDGWTNADHPTESTPGNASTLPPGASINEADVDYTGTIMPPSNSGVPPLTIDEKMAIARWIDLGAPIDVARSSYGWFLDDLRPTLEVSAPRAGTNPAPLDAIVVGVADADSGIAAGSLSVTADVAIDGHAPGEELAGGAVPAGDGIFRIPLGTPLQSAARAHLYVEVADGQGNVTRVDRVFSVGAGASPTPTAAGPTRTRTPTPAATPTVTPASQHDSLVVPFKRPLRVRIRPGAASRAARMRVTVRNADARSAAEGAGHVVQLVVDPGTCPSDVVSAAPDFLRSTAGAQDRVLVGAGRRKRAVVGLTVRAADFDASAAPATCALRVMAIGPGTDPTPDDAVIEVTVEVRDANDTR